MKLQTAINELKKEADFLGMTFTEVKTFIERNPYAASDRAIKALGWYNHIRDIRVQAITAKIEGHV